MSSPSSAIHSDRTSKNSRKSKKISSNERKTRRNKQKNEPRKSNSYSAHAISLEDLGGDITTERPTAKNFQNFSEIEAFPDFVCSVQTSSGFISGNGIANQNLKISDQFKQVAEFDFESKLRLFLPKLSFIAQGLLAGISLWQIIQALNTSDVRSLSCSSTKIFNGLFYFLGSLSILHSFKFSEAKLRDAEFWKIFATVLPFSISVIVNSILAQAEDYIFLNCVANSNFTSNSTLSQENDFSSSSGLDPARNWAAVIGFVLSVILIAK